MRMRKWRPTMREGAGRLKDAMYLDDGGATVEDEETT